MRGKRLSIGLRAVPAFVSVTLLVTGTWGAEKKLHNLGNGTDGASPEAGLIFDAAGNLYGTTGAGGTYGSGTVFEMTPNGSGGWTEKKLHNFGNGTDGATPEGGLIFDGAGNLYGTTSAGGTSGSGTVFEMTPNGSGGWTEKVLHNFGINGTDGINPECSLIFDSAGNLYGTTVEGGTYNAGTVFEMTPNGSGGWTEKKLHNFIRNGTDGIYPSAGLIFDTDGNLYGTTYGGGDYYRGTVFEMTPNGSGGWTEKKLHNFGNGTDGANPQDDLIFDAAGNLYGTTGEGGSNACGGPGCGTAFELMSDGGGTWTEKRLHNFGNGTDGVYPYGALIFDADGNLYGTTYGGGSNACTGFGCGVAFEMTPNGSGGWTEKKLHNFGSGTDGANPSASLIFDAEGNLYGTTTYGGSHNGGTVFEITP